MKLAQMKTRLFFKKTLCSCAICLIVLLPLLLPAKARADILGPGNEVVIQASVYNTHYHYSADHLRYSPLIGGELRKETGWLYGGALFLNSFGQFSQIAYGGYLWNFGNSGLYGKLVAGVIHGYRGEYKNKVPFNNAGFSPGVLPSLGYRYGRVRIETQFFWTNGLMVTAGIAFR